MKRRFGRELRGVPKVVGAIHFFNSKLVPLKSSGFNPYLRSCPLKHGLILCYGSIVYLGGKCA